MTVLLAFQGLNVLIDSLSNLNLNAESWKMMTHRLWVARHDEDEDIQKIATDLWNKAAMKVRKAWEGSAEALLHFRGAKIA